MAFRKRNIAIGRSLGDSASSPAEERLLTKVATAGLRPSPLTSNGVTSTGTPSLDGLMGGHAGLALGSGLLIEESGTTDFAGALLRYFAAEGICQGHTVHIVGAGDGWVRELPGVTSDKGRGKQDVPQGMDDKMKIAWRYEKLGQTSERDRASTASLESAQQDIPFCHTFDLTKRLTVPPSAKINHIPITTPSLSNVIQSLTRSLAASPPDTIHRLVIPSLLNPALYPPQTCRPENLLTFLLALRSVLHQRPHRLVALLTLPLELHPRTSGLVHWAELLSDGVLELTPFPHSVEASASSTSSTGGGGGAGSASRADEPQPQGLFHIHKLPLVTERGEGGAGVGNSIGADLAFTVSRRKFAIAPFALPPVEGDQEAQAEAGKLTGKDLEF